MQAEVESFVERQVAQAGQNPPSKRARDKPGTSNGLQPPAKKVAKTAQGVVLDIPLSEDGLMRCRLRDFKGKLFADLRKFYSVRIGRLLNAVTAAYRTTSKSSCA
jgi:hypothetical protein